MTTHINVKRWSIAVFGKMRVLALLSCTLSSTLAGLPRATPLQSSVIKYAGTLPCADCAGIRTLLTLYSEPGPTRYELAETYIGTKDGDRAFLNSGRWTILRGSAADADATVFQLDFDRPDRARNFLREGDYHLVQLDRNQAALPARNSHCSAYPTKH